MNPTRFDNGCLIAAGCVFAVMVAIAIVDVLNTENLPLKQGCKPVNRLPNLPPQTVTPTFVRQDFKNGISTIRGQVDGEHYVFIFDRDDAQSRKKLLQSAGKYASECELNLTWENYNTICDLANEVESTNGK